MQRLFCALRSVKHCVSVFKAFRLYVIDQVKVETLYLPGNRASLGGEDMHLAISIDEAVGLIPDGATVMLSGVMGVGVPDRIVHGLAEAGKRT